MYRCIVSDLDGTLLTSEKKILKETKDYIKKLQDKGILFIVATGRYFESARSFFDEKFYPDYLISNNGSYIYDCCKQKFIYKNVLDENVVTNILDISLQYSQDISLLGNDIYLQLRSGKEYVKDKLNMISGIAIHAKNKECQKILVELISKKFPQLDVYIMKHSVIDAEWIEISPKLISKGIALKKVLDMEKNNCKDAICFGDGANDISMFEVCGMSVAVANAIDQLKKIASGITDTNDNQGLYRYLKNKSVK